MEAYGVSKLMNILWTRELARRLSVTGATANCVHPGGVNTGFGDNNDGPLGLLFKLGKRFMLTPEQGADTLIYLASSPDVEGQTGGYWTKRKRIEPSPAARNDASATRVVGVQRGALWLGGRLEPFRNQSRLLAFSRQRDNSKE